MRLQDVDVAVGGVELWKKRVVGHGGVLASQLTELLGAGFRLVYLTGQ